MTFSSITFLFYFLPALFLIYYIVPKKAKNTVLFIASLIFYALADTGYVLLLLFSCVFNYLSGFVISKAKNKIPVTVNIAVNIGILLFFRFPGLLLPLGLAFYTLRALTYTIDIYRRTTALQRNFINFGLYLSLFALIPAGPVVRYNDVARQLTNRHSTGTRFLDGVTRFCAGLCKKVVIADSLYPLWNVIFGYDLTGLSAAHAWLGIICFALWIYFAFSGYSDIAIGLGKMFGFEFVENFNYPYTAKSIAQFCSRWHISLIKWFKEYVYTRRRGVIRTSINLLLLWVLIGLWYDGRTGTVLWAVILALFIIIEQLALKKVLPKIGILANIYTLFIVTVAFVPFAFTDFSDAIAYLGAMFGSYGGFGEQDFLYNMTSYAGTIILAIIVASGLPKRIGDRFKKHEYIRYIFALAGFLISLAYIV